MRKLAALGLSRKFMMPGDDKELFMELFITQGQLFGRTSALR